MTLISYLNFVRLGTVICIMRVMSIPPEGEGGKEEENKEKDHLGR